MSGLFSETMMKNHKIRNRVIFPAMIACDMQLPDGRATAEAIAHYERIAQTGVGMIVTGGVAVDPYGKINGNQLAVWSDEFIPGLAKIAAVCHENDTPVLMQIADAGLRSVSAQGQPVSSGDFEMLGVQPRPLLKEEIKALQDAFVEAAVRAQQAGFDGIELHGAHTYLLDQFFSAKINTRTDEYGGNVQNRARIATEIVERIKPLAREDFIIACRMGCNYPTIEECVEIAQALVDAGVDFLDLSFGTITNADMMEGRGPQAPAGFPYSGMVYAASQFKQAVDVPVSIVWEITDPQIADGMIADGMTDFVDVLRAMLVDPDWVKKAEAGRAEDITSCLNCKPACWWFKNRDRCPRYARTGRWLSFE